MSSNPKMIMYGESNGDKKGIRIEAEGDKINLFDGTFDTEAHGVEFKNVGFLNDKNSSANMSDIITDSPIINTGGSYLSLKRAKILTKQSFKDKIKKFGFWIFVHRIEIIIAIVVGILLIIGYIKDYFL